jgi:hypothetical protein
MDPVLKMMEKYEIPVTKENYIEMSRAADVVLNILAASATRARRPRSSRQGRSSKKTRFTVIAAAVANSRAALKVSHDE